MQLGLHSAAKAGKESACSQEALLVFSGWEDRPGGMATRPVTMP